MDAPLVLKFIVKFMSEESFRMSVLREEMTAMAAFGLSESQAMRLRSLDSKAITDLLIEEAKAVGADIVKTKNIMLRNESCGAITTFTAAPPPPEALSPMLMAEAAMYEEGRIHLHCVDAEAPSGGVTRMWIRGHGLGESPEFEFRLENTATKTAGTVLSTVQVGNDLFQRVQVQAPLTSGKWLIFSRNSASQDFDAMTAKPYLPVVAP